MDFLHRLEQSASLKVWAGRKTSRGTRLIFLVNGAPIDPDISAQSGVGIVQRKFRRPLKGGRRLQDDVPEVVQRPSGPSRGDGHLINEEQLDIVNQPSSLSRRGEGHLEDDVPEVVQRPSGPSRGDESLQGQDFSYLEEAKFVEGKSEPPKGGGKRKGSRGGGGYSLQHSGPSDGAGHKRFADDEH